MPVYLVCSICGGQFECNGPHDGPHEVLSPIKKCPLNKGGIYVYVKDSLHQGVPDVKVYCGKSDGTTTPQGFVSFSELPADTYPTRIVLEESGKEVKAGYFATTRKSLSPVVEAGKITVVEFALNKYASLLVRMMRTDGESDLPRAKFTVESSGHTLDEPILPAVTGKAEFQKLKPTETYTVRCELEEEDRKNFKVEQDKYEQTDIEVTSAKQVEVIFRIERRYWIDLSLIDKKDPSLKGSFALEPGKGEMFVEADVGSHIRHIPNLNAGKIKISGVTLGESREFVSLT